MKKALGMCGVEVPEEIPQEKDADGCLVEKPSPAKPDAEKTATETPSAEKPDAEKPDAGQSSTESKETEVGQSTNPQKEISKYDCHAACGTISTKNYFHIPRDNY